MAILPLVVPHEHTVWRPLPPTGMIPPMYTRRSTALLAFFAASVAATPALAQSPELTGLARAAGDKHALSCIRVALTDSAGREVAFARTDWRGLFAIAAPGRGIYQLRFESPMTAPVLGPVDTLTDSSYVERVYELPFIWTESAARAAAATQQGELRPIVSPAPHYPEKLRDARIEGEVVAEFVIDTAGAVDSTSIRIVRAAAPEFGAAVTTALGKSIFRPPVDHGVAVCERWLQLFTFQVRR